MTKRKRPSDEDQAESADYGVGATLAALRGNEDTTDTAVAGSGDDGGWTTVVNSRKKRRQRDSHKERKDSSSTSSKASGRPQSESQGEADTQGNGKQKPSTSHHASHSPNPFSENPADGKRDAPPTNPFSANNKGAERERSKSAQNTSSDRKREKEERGKERKLDRNYPVIEHSHHARLNYHVKISDLQSLVLYILVEGNAPQWVSVQNRGAIRHVVMLLVPGLESGMFNGKLSLDSHESAQNEGSVEAIVGTAIDNVESDPPKRLTISPDDYYPVSLKSDRMPEALQKLSGIFRNIWPIKTPGDHNSNQYRKVHSPVDTMLTSQIPKSKDEKQMKKSSSHKGPVPQDTKHWENKRTPVTEFLATLVEQQENEYVIHPTWFTTPEAKDAALQGRKAARTTVDDGWVDTNITSLEEGDVPESEIEQGSVTAGKKVLAIDCEMCKSENDELVLTRISVLDWDGSVVIDRLVKPDVTIKDYLTRWSGITPTMLQDVTTTLADIQKELLEIITPRTILVGHSLNSDLNALKLTHPFIIDTGIIYPHARGPPYKQSLKWLAQKFLSLEIQKGAEGHDSIDDAQVCLDLLKQKCERGPKWGTSETNAESIFKRLGRAIRPKSSNSPRAGAVVDWGDLTRGHGAQAQVTIGCKSDAEVVEGIDRAVNGFAQGKDGATEKVDFVWGRLRELELARGWWEAPKLSNGTEAIRQAALERLGLATSRGEDEEVDVTGAKLGEAVSRTVEHIAQVYESLPRCTAFIVYSGTGDPREVRRLQAMYQQHKREYATKNWDNLSVKWTDTEVQALSQACQSARDGVGFVVVK
ncbi:hypothetical protein BDV95DRAFT_485908 [Massariosphaeria phaeospora]|uniref:Exonuclease domain-containing protein n=1 Tax=Massariosphaeria phaeospora TaxID=100035 RepID=A0A7C8IK56_9PLEO|nr:hypothetical protein BDV95DRAFT_485908 [Massariosphaeria phaeospora]